MGRQRVFVLGDAPRVVRVMSICYGRAKGRVPSLALRASGGVASWFAGEAALADGLAASRAAGAVFALDGFVEVDLGDVGESDQPGEDVGELQGEVFLRALA